MESNRIVRLIRLLHEDERGGEEQASKMLTFALIALPLLALLVLFKDKVSEFFKELYKKFVKDPDTPTFP